MEFNNFLTAQTGAIFVFLGTAGTAQAAQIFHGEAKPLGNGTVRTWVELDSNSNPSDIGLVFTEAALSGLPTESDEFDEYPLKLTLQDGIGHSTFEYELMLPQEASATPFTHVGLNWNPHGHAPGGILDLPHFDFHFYTISPEERYGITAVGDDLDRSYRMPPSGSIPSDYVLADMSAEPRMGVHWVDLTAPEFNGEIFTKGFVYGSYDGKVAFWEPMITRDFFLTEPDFSQAIKQPSFYAESGYYPTDYSIKYDPLSSEYTVSLNNLTFRASSTSVPEPSSIIVLLAFSVFGLGLAGKGQLKGKS